MEKRITLIRIPKPTSSDVNIELQWLGNSLGLFNDRDKDKSCYRIFVTLIKAAKHERPLSSDQMAEHLNLSRGTVIHHMNKLMSSGLVLRERQGYVLRINKMESLIVELQRDMERMCSNLKTVAKELDGWLGL
ncbi:MAG: winged helix-turn-helix transcriptional regulator [Nanoarchaeota archaeon]|nr:winged helix-turn-helix transcriptional regulator [Nanoarchaeota archaeon]